MERRTLQQHKDNGRAEQQNFYCPICKVALSETVLKDFKNLKNTSITTCPFCLQDSVRAKWTNSLSGVVMA